MEKIDFLADYPEYEDFMRNVYAPRIRKYSSVIKDEYDKNHGNVSLSLLFTEEEIEKFNFYSERLYVYAKRANAEGYAPIRFGDESILSGEYQWTTERDFISQVENGYLPSIKDGTGSVNCYKRAEETSKTAQSTNRAILATFHRKNKIHADHDYFPIYEEMGFYNPNRKDSVNAGEEWWIGIDSFTKYDVLFDDKIEKSKSTYYPSSAQQKVRELKSFVDKCLEEDPNYFIKLAIFIKCRGGKTPAFIDLLIQVKHFDFCFFIARRTHVAYEVVKNVKEFFSDDIKVIDFRKFLENPFIPKGKIIFTNTVQSFEDNNYDFDNEMSKLSQDVKKIKKYLKGKIGCITWDEAQIGGHNENAEKVISTFRELLDIRMLIDLSGTPSKLLARREYDKIVEFDLLDEIELRDQQRAKYGVPNLCQNFWD